jgi:diguanylate cyclase (GGDEF)-like protein/PAS domain S-box-containing protein
LLLPSGPAELSNAVRVLLLEDERTCAEIVAQYLRSVRGLELRLDVTTTLAEARAHLARGAYDLLIVDLNLPDSKGLATLDAMQGSNALVIVLTSDDDAGTRETVLARGAYDFMHKAQLDRGSFERLVRLAAVQADTVRSLRRSQARLRAIVDAEPECVKLLDRDGNLIEMNPAGLRMIEAESLDAVRGQCVFPLVLPEHRAAFRALVERVADGGEGVLEVEITGLKGARRWVQTHAVPLRDEASGERLVLGIARDVTAQRRAERSQKESEERFRLALDNSADMIVLVERATMRFIDCNNTICRLTGYTREELLAMKPWDLLPVTREQLEEAYDRQIADSSHAAGLRSYYRCKDGSQLPFESRRQVLRSGDSWIITAIARDIRERITADQALRESEERFRSLVELSSDFYWETDAEHRVVHTTRDQKYRPVGDPVIGRTRWDRSSIRPDAAGWAAHRATLDARLPFHDFEIERIDADGVRRYRSLSGEPIFGANGEFLGYRGVGRDTTERRREERLVTLEHAVSRALTGAWSASGAVRAVIRAVCESEGWPMGRYFAVDDEAGVLRFGEAWGSDDSVVQKFIESSRAMVYRRGEGLSGWVWREGKPLSVADTSKEPRALSASPFARGPGLGGGAFVFPVIFEGKTIGVLSFSSQRAHEADERLLQTIHVVGSQVGQFLQRKQAEAALAESEERFRETFELAATGIAHVALDGRFLHVNRRLCEMLGYTEAELVGRSVKDLSHPDDRDVTDGERERMRSGELPSARFEKRYFRKDGSMLWVALTVALARDAAGAPLHEISVLEEITERKEREAALQRFRTALDSSADMVFLFRLRDGTLLDFNETVCAALGYTRSELLALRATDVRTDATPESLRSEITELLASPSRSNTVMGEYRRKDGSTFPVESRRSIIDTPQGRVLVVNSRDLSERRSAEKRRATQARYQKKIARLGQTALAKRDAADLLEHAAQSVLEGLSGGVVAYVERGATPGEVVLKRVDGLAEAVPESSVANCRPESALGRMLEDSQPLIVNAPWGEGEPLPFPWAGRHRAAAIVPVPGDRGARGALCALAEQPRAFGPEELRFLGAAASMVSAALHRLDSEARLAYLAQFDALTGLPNRALLSDRFTQMIVLARRRGAPLGVLFIDLDDFKLVNDTQGHAAGDELLKETARRLLGSVRQGDTVARISGDEFAVILGDLTRADDAALVAQKIIDKLGEAFAIYNQQVFVTASIGIATFPGDGDNAESLLSAADAAMYRAKQAGRNAFQFFTADINQRTRARAQLGVELRHALERNEFSLAYQPKIDLASGQPSGAEALLRWNHPERGSVAPVEFIPVLEETGLIVQVGEWVLQRACQDLKAWQASGRRVMPVAVNLSARQFRQQDLDARIRAIVDAAGIAPSLIELEITESQLMHDPEHAAKVLRALGKAGLRVAIDDFGTGYSSLAYLTRFPLASLKIDRSFVAHVLSDEADATIVRTIVEMAHTLGFTVVAEGVESGGQADFLRELGCEQAQGFLFARPMPAAAFTAHIAAARARLKAPPRSAPRRRSSKKKS